MMDMTEEKEMPMTKQNPPQFIPKLKGKKVVIRLVSGDQPVTGTIVLEIAAYVSKTFSLRSSNIKAS